MANNLVNLTRPEKRNNYLEIETLGSQQSARSAAEEQLEILNQESQRLASGLLKAIQELMDMPRNTKWNTFVQALACIWKESEIRAFEEDIDRICKQLDTTLLMCLREQMDRMMHDKTRFINDDEIRNLSKDMHDFMEGEDAAGFSDKLTSSIENKRKIRFGEHILRHLSFIGMASREEEICVAHRQTFGWIFKDKTNISTSGMVNFVPWLQADEGDNLYWIMGKAGSGKSTLTKFILQTPKTRKLLQDGEWVRNRELLIVPFFLLECWVYTPEVTRRSTFHPSP
ncbi:hypothetical protein F5Y16DRAFT_406009 [Xylariaceae sp. FL0255]|nr:hypothetical protein F5Y16DRAFT_406009 [Xylariaceae sp. FL0255]